MPSVAAATSWGDGLALNEQPSHGLMEAALPGNLVLGAEQTRLVVSLEETYSALLAGAAPLYNPIILQGPSGVGKTHLMRAICDSLRCCLGKSGVYYVAAAEYAQELGEAVEADDVSAWRDRHRSTQLFVLDDLEHLAGKELAQDELTRSLDFLVAEGRQAILISHAAHARTKGFNKRLLARITAGLTLRMSLPEIPAREAILRAVAESKLARISDAAFGLLATELADAPSALIGAVTYLQTVGGGAEIDKAAAQAYLDQRGVAQKIGVREIAAATARQFAMPLTLLRGESRRKTVVAARGAAMWLARQLTGASLEQIGAYFGGRDHTTVLHACRRTEELTAHDGETRRAVDEIRATLGATR
ncbi:MAG: DnaA/Hda family protein [Planctomycetia bacterium]|nr:DnaA/Hda family protein [Planctomycetia bacterium]